MSITAKHTDEIVEAVPNLEKEHEREHTVLFVSSLLTFRKMLKLTIFR